MMESSCLPCGCYAGAGEHDVATCISRRQYALAYMQQSSMPFAATLVAPPQRFIPNETNEVNEAGLATDAIQGYALDVIHRKLNMETLPDGFACNRMSDKILLYKLDINEGLITLECGIILTSDFQVSCSSYNEVLPVGFYEDLLSQGKQVTMLSQLLNLMVRLGNYRQGRLTGSNGDVKDIKRDESVREAMDTASCVTEPTETDTKPAQDAASTSQPPDDTAHQTKCPLCKKTFNFLKDLKQHIRHVRVMKKRHRCNKREKSSTVQSESSTPRAKRVRGEGKRPKRARGEPKVKRVRGEKKYMCDKCDFSTKSGHILTRHISAIHLAEKPHKCPKCTLCFSQKGNLARHIRCVHNHEKPHSCTECQKSFISLYYLQNHIDIVHRNINLYSCAECGGGFSTPQNLQRHINAVHLKLKPYGCTMCSKSFSTKTLIRLHVDSVHNGCKSSAAAAVQ